MNHQTSPSFENPPVVETAMSIQFDELVAFQNIHFGLFYEQVRNEFPDIEDRPRLDHVKERFPFPLPAHLLKLNIVPERPQRVWFKSADNARLLQLQPDRFALNWRKIDNLSYPRYASNKPILFEEFQRFKEFALANGLEKIQPNLCEITYVNQIQPRPEETVSECFQSVFHGIQWNSSDGWLKNSPEAITLNRVYTIGEDQGHLYFEASTAMEQTENGSNEFIALKITARVIHNEDEDIEQNMDLAHEWVVKSFASLTEESSHRERWRRIDG